PDRSRRQIALGRSVVVVFSGQSIDHCGQQPDCSAAEVQTAPVVPSPAPLAFAAVAGEIQNGAGRRWHYSGLSACLPRPVRALGASRNRDRSPGRSIWMRTDDLPLLRQALLTIPLVLSAACGSTAGSPPEVVQTPPDAGPTVPAVDPGPSLARTEGWSVRRRMRLPARTDVVPQEQLATFTLAPPPPSPTPP